jgi:hypothetical protein
VPDRQPCPPLVVTDVPHPVILPEPADAPLM